jgi:hypothetical protein
MSRAFRVCVALFACACANGCGHEGDAPPSAPTATPGSNEYAVAYAVARDEVPKLARKALPDALDHKKVVASSQWKPYTLVVLLEWLHERGIDLDPPPPFDTAATEIGDRWDVQVLLVTAEHKRRYQQHLQRLTPDSDELRDFYNEFNADNWPEAGAAMADWLRIVKASMTAATSRRTVVIPLTDWAEQTRRPSRCTESVTAPIACRGRRADPCGSSPVRRIGALFAVGASV